MKKLSITALTPTLLTPIPLTLALLAAVLPPPAAAQRCPEVKLRLWQKSGETWYDHGETITLAEGEEGHVYVQVSPPDRGPYLTTAEVGYPASLGLGGSRDVSRHLSLSAQDSEDRGIGRIRFVAQQAGTVSLGYRITGVRDPGRLEDVSQACRTGTMEVRVTGGAGGDPDDDARAIELCQDELKREMTSPGSRGRVVAFDRVEAYGMDAEAMTGVRGHAEVRGRTSSQVRFECMVNVRRGNVGRISYRYASWVGKGGAYGRRAELVERCHEAVHTKVGGGQAANLVMDFTSVELLDDGERARGEAVAISDGNERPLTYECRLDTRRGSVTSASFSYGRTIDADLTRQLSALCHEALRKKISDDRRGRDVILRLLSADAYTISAREQGLRGEAQIETPGDRPEAITYDCVANVDGRYVIRSSYAPSRGPGSVPGAPRTVRCESQDNRYQLCRVDTRGGVILQRQLSRAECRQGESWGYDTEGIWVDDGCRADFQVGATPR